MGSHVCPGQRVYTEWRYTARNVGVGSVPDVLIVWLTVLVSGPCTHVRDGRNAGTIMPLAPDQILVNCPSKFGNYPRVIVIRPSPLPRYCYLIAVTGKDASPLYLSVLEKLYRVNFRWISKLSEGRCCGGRTGRSLSIRWCTRQSVSFSFRNETGRGWSCKFDDRSWNGTVDEELKTASWWWIMAEVDYGVFEFSWTDSIDGQGIRFRNSRRNRSSRRNLGLCQLFPACFIQRIYKVRIRISPNFLIGIIWFLELCLEWME